MRVTAGAVGGVFCIVAAWAGAANAAPLTDWNAPGVQVIHDAVGDAQTFRDITALYYRADGGFYYVRLDLSVAPTNAPGQAAPDYFIYFDDRGGGASGGDGTTNDTLSRYVGEGIDGIDRIVDAHFGIPFQNHWHVYDPDGDPFYHFQTRGVLSLGGAYQQTENGGRSLEWKVPIELPLAAFRVSAGTLNYRQELTFDTIGAVVGEESRIIDMRLAGTNVSLTVTGRAGLEPTPQVTAGLAGQAVWQGVVPFESTYPQLFEGTYTLTFGSGTNAGAAGRYYKVVATNTSPVPGL